MPKVTTRESRAAAQGHTAKPYNDPRTNDEAVQRAEEFEEAVAKTFKCPVCLEHMVDGSILQCDNEHLVCGGCHFQLPDPKTCPTCRSQNKMTTCRLMESLREDLPFFCCPFSSCNHKSMSIEDARQHAMNDPEHKCEGEFSIDVRGQEGKDMLLGLSGTGKITFNKRRVYQGEVKDTKQHGQGKYTYASGDSYDGAWKDGNKHGQGVMTYADGCYNGAWENGKKHGQGVMKFGNGNHYNGNWKDGKKHGKGVKTFRNGNHYDGKWKDGKEHGQGVMAYANHDRYEGEWKKGKGNGHGVMAYANGDRYEGAWKDGKRHGQQGVMTHADGKSVYIGAWKEGEMHGKGTLCYLSDTNTILTEQTKNGATNSESGEQ